VVDMTMAEEYIRVGAGRALDEFISQQPQARAGIEYEKVVAAADLHAGGIAAVARRSAPRGGNAPAHPPKADRNISHRKLPANPPLLCENLP
jgi:hypothetical protein